MSMQVNLNHKAEKSLFGSATKDKNNFSKKNTIENRKSSSKSDYILSIF